MSKPFRAESANKAGEAGGRFAVMVWCLGDVVVDVHALPAGFGPSEKIVCVWFFFLSITLGTL